MRISTLSKRLSDGLVAFGWEEWAQMGMLAAGSRQSPWAQDPEALIVFTLDVARDDPRLFDELLDWLLTNGSLLSTRRLRVVCRAPDDSRLVEATLRWLARSRPGKRAAPADDRHAGGPVEPLFRGLSEHVREPDPTFASSGFVRPIVQPRRNSQPPDTRAPINLAFRLRQLLGVSARAEVVRYLMTTPQPAATAQAVASSAAYAKRNVHEALTALHSAGATTVRTSAGAQHYATDRAAWAALLGLDGEHLPQHRDWPQLLGGVRVILAWLREREAGDLSQYLLASQARDLLEDVRDELEHAGLSVGRRPADGAWQDLEAVVADALDALQPPVDRRGG